VDGDVLSEIDPANDSIRINQKLRWPRNVGAFGPCAGMEHIVTANDLCLRIGKQRESVPELLRLPPIDLRRIDADACDADSACIKFGKPLLKTPQLGVT
jgi:hypothetical protein